MGASGPLDKLATTLWAEATVRSWRTLPKLLESLGLTGTLPASVRGPSRLKVVDAAQQWPRPLQPALPLPIACLTPSQHHTSEEDIDGWVRAWCTA